MTSSSDGVIWFGADDGIVRYDGIEWTSVPSPATEQATQVRTLVAGPQSEIYTGTETGIFEYSQQVWRPVFPRPGNPPFPVYDLLRAADGSLWAATGWGALHISDADTTLFTSADMARTLQALVPSLRVETIPAPQSRRTMASVSPCYEGTSIRIREAYRGSPSASRPTVLPNARVSAWAIGLSPSMARSAVS